MYRVCVEEVAVGEERGTPNLIFLIPYSEDPDRTCLSFRIFPFHKLDQRSVSQFTDGGFRFRDVVNIGLHPHALCNWFLCAVAQRPHLVKKFMRESNLDAF